VLKEAAVALVSKHIPKPSRADRAQALRAAIGEAHRNGITSIQNAGGDAEEFDLFAEARREGDLLIRVYSALTASGVLSEETVAGLSELIKKYPDDPLFKSGAVEIELDGSIDARTAAMLEPYSAEAGSAETTGTISAEPDELNRTVRLLDSKGLQVMTQASGDRAVRMALDAYEHAVRSNPLPERGRRHRIEQAEVVDATDVPRFGALGVVASMQPFRGSPSPAQIDVWFRNLGPERGSRGWPYGSIAAGAGRLAFGSGWPGMPMNPMLGLHTAVSRTTPDNVPQGGWYPSERIALKTAIDAYTSGAAWASFDEQRKGSIEPGMLADLVVLSDDIFEAPARLASTRVAVTIFDGKIVYQRDGRQTTN
jgi:predicted amidohydrolase YtcJ